MLSPPFPRLPRPPPSLLRPLSTSANSSSRHRQSLDTAEQHYAHLLQTAEQHYAHLLQRCSQTSNLPLAASLHARLLKLPLLSSSLFLQNHLLNSYFRCSPSASLPLHLFDEMPHRNVVSWSSAIAGLVHRKCPDRALSLFLQMRRDGVWPNEFSLVSALHASSLSESPAPARQVYVLVIRLGFESNVFLVNAFLMALVRNGRMEEAAELFDKCRKRDVVSWNSMIAGFSECECSEVWGFWCRMIQEGVSPDEFSFSSVLTGLASSLRLDSGRQVHAQLVKSGFGGDVCVGNSLADMYLKNRGLVSGVRAFNEMQERDVVSWTQMAAGYLDYGQPAKALEVIDQMKLVGIRLNKFTLATAFNACSNLASVEEGRKAHGFRVKLGEDVDACVDNALVDMYAKCGSMRDAWKVFRPMTGRSVVSWTTMIMGFAQNGLPRQALQAFDEMILEGVEPNYITFICVLYACSQGGFVDEGWKYFLSMTNDRGLAPGEDHYACMVDLLGKTGHIEEAEALILSMPFRPGVLVWQTLLGACRIHGDVETGKRAAENALALEKSDPSTYLLLSNMFANSSNWDGVGWVRKLMGSRELQKMPGSSWIHIAKGGR